MIIVKDIKLNENIENFSNEIDYGEIAVISLAMNLKPKLILIDDLPARIIAESLGFKVRGTLYVLLLAYRKNLINKSELIRLVNQLLFAGFRISQEMYIKFLEEIEKC